MIGRKVRYLLRRTKFCAATSGVNCARQLPCHSSSRPISVMRWLLALSPITSSMSLSDSLLVNEILASCEVLIARLASADDVPRIAAANTCAAS
jgi:hypothetical protein